MSKSIKLVIVAIKLPLDIDEQQNAELPCISTEKLAHYAAKTDGVKEVDEEIAINIKSLSGLRFVLAQT